MAALLEHSLIVQNEETLITLNDATRLKWLPRRYEIKLLYRWARVGLRGVRLETLKAGGSLCTSEPALRRFFAALSPHPAPTPPPGHVSKARRRAIEQAERECRALGV